MERRHPVDFRRIRQLIHPKRALALVGWVPEWDGGINLRGPCPFHRSSSPRSRSLSVTDRVYYCHKCHATGDAVAVWQWHTGLDPLDAAVDLCNRLGVPVPYLF